MEASNSSRAPSSPFFGWSPILAGAFIAAALFFILLSFGAALGLGTASSAPTWRDASIALAILSGVYLLLASVASFAVGGYISGRLRSWSGLHGADPEFYAGVRGLIVWALSIVFGALLAFAATQALRPATAYVGNNAGAASSPGGEALIAYELDRLFRAERRPADADVSYPRAEAARILLSGSGHSGMAAEDRAYLTTLTRSATGLTQPEADRRVDVTVVRARDAISRARKLTVLIGFMTAASLLLGAVISWLASERGERDGRGLDRAAMDDWFKLRPVATASDAPDAPVAK
ncbi:MAG: hypothetical protein Q7T73_07335 [Beijerinckiaceae bacterium]|nr:hypothetical protein [Beijerinckiaceae bacterium]